MKAVKIRKDGGIVTDQRSQGDMRRKAVGCSGWDHGTGKGH